MGLKLLPYSFFTLICIPGLCAFTLVPSKNPVAVGTNVTISAINSSPISITFGSWLFGASTLFIWFGEDVITGSGHQAGIEFNNSTYQLTLPSVALNSSGKYVLESFKPNKISSAVTLDVQEPVSNINAGVSMTNVVEFNDTVTFTCSASGTPLWFSWLNGISAVTQGGRVQLSNNGQNLVISGVTRYDEGPFKCIVVNNVSKGESAQMSLNISYGPSNLTIAASPEKSVHASGSAISLSCSAESKPTASFNWMFNGSDLNVYGSTYNLSNITPNTTGLYTCVAHNAATQRYVAVSKNISVVDPISAVALNPSGSPVEGMPFNLSCNVVGPVDSIQWMKNDANLSANDMITFLNGNSILSFKKMALSDDGPYKCAASNAVSNMNSQDYNLTVSYGPWNLTIKGPTMAQIGSNLTFSCSADSRPESQYSWSLNGSKVGDGQVFVTEALSRNNSGDYTCTAFNIITGNSVSASLQLTLKYPVTHVTVNANNQQPIFNQPFTLTCNANGDVEHIQWMKNNMSLSPVNGITFSSDNSTLTFQNLSLSDDGHYKCEAKNTVSNSISEPHNLTVNYGPWNFTIEGPTMAQIGPNVTFSCSAVSRPQSQYSWSLNGSKVGDGQVFVTEALSRNNSGNYTCTAFNSITGNSVSASLQLTLKYPVTQVTVNANNQQPIFNQPFTLTCNANGDVEHIQWMKNNMSLSPVNGITFSSDNSTLTFQNLSLSDDGHYKCEAKNTVSNFISEPHNLTVNYGPWNLTIEGPNMTEIGSNVTFICSALSRPQSQYSWYRNGSKVADGQVYATTVLSQNSNGEYTCTAHNNITVNSSSTSLQFTAIDPLISVDLTADRLIPLASQSLQLTCKVNGPYDKIYWLRNNLTFQPSNGITFSADNTIVTFQSLQTANEGKYQCVARNALKDLASPRYDLVVIFGPQSVQIIVHPGIPPKLTCQAVSQPPAVFHWINENNTVVGNDSTIEVPIKYILGSNYTCVAKNPLTNVTVFTSQVINDPNAAVSVQASVVLTVLLALLIPLLKE